MAILHNRITSKIWCQYELIFVFEKAFNKLASKMEKTVEQNEKLMKILRSKVIKLFVCKFHFMLEKALEKKEGNNSKKRKRKESAKENASKKRKLSSKHGGNRLREEDVVEENDSRSGLML